MVLAAGLLAALAGVGCDQAPATKGAAEPAPAEAVTKPAAAVAAEPAPVTGAEPTPAPPPAISADAERRTGSPSDRTPQGGAAPKIVFAKSSHDFGVTYDDKPLEYIFEYSNDGSSNLTIGRVATSCGCTSTTLGKDTIAPGETGALKATFRPKKTSGVQTKQITVFSNDPGSPQTVLTVSARMIQAVEVESLLRLGTFQKGRTHTAKLPLRARDADFKFKRLTFNNDKHVSYRIVEDAAAPTPRDAETPGYMLLEFEVAADTPTGAFNREATITVLASPEPGMPQTEQQYKVRMFGQVQGDVIVNPTYMRVYPVEPGASFESSAIFTTRSGREFKVLETSLKRRLPQLADCQTSFEPIVYQGKPSYRIIVRGVAGDSNAAFRGDVVVKTDIADEPERSIAFNGQVRARGERPAARPAQRPELKPTDR